MGISDTASNFTLSGATAVFKDVYQPMSEYAINHDTAFLSALYKTNNWVGNQLEGAAKLSSGKGVGASVIPYPSVPKYAKVLMSAVPVWVTPQLDLQAVLASSNSTGAFINATRDEVEDSQTFLNYVLEYVFLNDATGAIGTLDFSAGISSASDADTGLDIYTFTVTDATWFEPIYMPGMIVNFGTDVEPFIIQAVDWADKQITVSKHPDYTHSFNVAGIGSDTVFYIDRFKTAGMSGLGAVADAVDNGSATLYNVRVQPRWVSNKYAAGGSPLVTDMIIETVAKARERTKIEPNMIICASEQYAQLENQFIGKTEWREIVNQNYKSDTKAAVGYPAMCIRCRGKEVMIAESLMCPKDTVYLVNTDKRFMRLERRAEWGWQDFIDGGKRWLRDYTIGQVPKARALLGGYCNLFVHPSSVSKIDGLEVVSNVT